MWICSISRMIVDVPLSPISSYLGYVWFELAGHYVPNLVQQVVHHNAEPGAFFLNLKGFAVLPFTLIPACIKKIGKSRMTMTKF